MAPTKVLQKKLRGLANSRELGREVEAQRRGPRELQVRAPGARFSPLHPEVPPPGASDGADRGCPQWALARSSPPAQRSGVDARCVWSRGGGARS